MEGYDIWEVAALEEDGTPIMVRCILNEYELCRFDLFNQITLSTVSQNCSKSSAQTGSSRYTNGHRNLVAVSTSAFEQGEDDGIIHSLVNHAPEVSSHHLVLYSKLF